MVTRSCRDDDDDDGDADDDDDTDEGDVPCSMLAMVVNQ